MEYNLMIGGIGFHIVSHFEIRVGDIFTPFLLPSSAGSDVFVEFRDDFQNAPAITVPMLGDDVLLEYYDQDGFLTATKGGQKGHIAVALCDPACTHLVCYINTGVFGPQDALSDLLRMIPMRRILQHHGVLFFHASQIALGNSGVLFTAPSGTGKTTQARLWRDHRAAAVICNDRTLVCRGRTYGYPVDGSEPVRSGLIHDLGAIVLLKQNKENSVRRLKPSAALAGLLPQLVIDTWDPTARTFAIEQLMELLRSFPVYLLECTPDSHAVDCLHRQLTEDGVIK